MERRTEDQDGDVTELIGPGSTATIELLEERLIPRRERKELGEIVVRTVVDEVPGHVEVDADREDIEIVHEPGGQTVAQRVDPYEENGELVIPVYEEQLVVSKRLVLKERLRIKRVAVRETQVFEDTLRRERIVIEDPADTGLVRERYPD